jgi:hypothetical protein
MRIAETLLSDSRAPERGEEGISNINRSFVAGYGVGHL